MYDYTIIGGKRAAGEFEKNGQKITYDNINLTLIKDVYVKEGDFGFGSVAETIKIKNNADTFEEIFGRDMTAEEIEGLCGQRCDVHYNKYGNVIGIVLEG